MAPAPLVSIVIPSYNHAHFLGEALASVETAALPIEIVVVDDGSTDTTPELLAAFETPHAFRHIRQSNAGLAAARNRGLAESKGEFVIFLDADDRFAPGGIDIGVDAIRKRPECAFVFGRCVSMDRGGTLLPTRRHPRIVREHYRALLRRNHIWMPGMVVFRHSALDGTRGFNTAIDAAADYELYLELARQYPVYDHGRVVAHYRRHDKNMSEDAARMLRETLAVMKGQRRHVEGDPAGLAAYEAGWRHWQDFYGSALATEIRSAVRGWRLGEAVAKAVVLGRYHPRGLLHHARRKTELTLAAAGRRRRPAASEDGGP